MTAQHGPDSGGALTTDTSQDPRSNHTAWPDLAGRIEGRCHRLPVRVYFEDTDFSGIVYHASYVRWCERGRSDFLRLVGLHHATLANPTEDAAEPIAFAVRRLEIDYRKPARIDDILEVETELAELGRVDCWLEQRVVRDGTVLAAARIQAVVLSASGRLQRMERAIGSALHRFLPSVA